MKKIFAVIILVTTVFHSRSQECNGVSAIAFPKNPQSGPTYYYGVRVMLDHIDSESITVTGGISVDGGPAALWSLTLPAGSTYTETSDTFYQTNSVSEVVVSIQTIDPCPLNIPYDYIGVYHNDGINNCKTSQSRNDCIISYGEGLFPGVLTQQTILDIIDAAAYAALNDSINYVPQYLSSGAQSYCSQLISMIDGIEESFQITQVISDISNLETTISTSNLPEKEKHILLYAGSIGRHSLNFWFNHIDTTENLAMEVKTSTNNSIINKPSIYDYDLANNELPSYDNSNRFEFDYLSTVPYKKGWLRQLLHVVVGDVVGGIVGAGIGSLLPGGVTTFVGALYGAMSGSLYAAEYEGVLQ